VSGTDRHVADPCARSDHLVHALLPGRFVPLLEFHRPRPGGQHEIAREKEPIVGERHATWGVTGGVEDFQRDISYLNGLALLDEPIRRG
jgi:hypothetical protein